jgi:hypothetical protein
MKWFSASQNYGIRPILRPAPDILADRKQATIGSELATSLTAMRAECEKLDLNSTADLISHIESEVSRKGEDYSNGDMVNHLDTLGVSFANELRRKSCFRIAQEKDLYFQNSDSFGTEVNQAFPSCVDEIRNAGNCYALEQNEACVFHLMRVLERGLNALATKFNVPFQHDSWHNIIEQIESKTRKMDSSYGHDWKDQQKFYSGFTIHVSKGRMAQSHHARARSL